MKSRKLNTKLALNKKTIANMNTAEMSGAVGGRTGSPCPIDLSDIFTNCSPTFNPKVCFPSINWVCEMSYIPAQCETI